MSRVAELYKDPNDKDFFWIDWSQRLEEGETITESSWTADSGIQIDGTLLDGNIGYVWLIGGTNRNVYTVTNRITTSDGRILDQSLKIRVREN